MKPKSLFSDSLDFREIMYKKFILIALVISILGASAQQNNIAAQINTLEQTVVRAIPSPDTIALKKIWEPDMMVMRPLME